MDIALMPDDGYEVASVIVNGEAVIPTPKSAYSIMNITKAYTVEVLFQLKGSNTE